MTTEIAFDPLKEVGHLLLGWRALPSMAAVDAFLLVKSCMFSSQSARACHGIMQVASQLEVVSRNGSSNNEVPARSLARTDYANESEIAVNEQVELPISEWQH